MADVPWNSSVQSAKTLTVDASGVRGHWKTAIDAAIHDLNVVLTSSGVNVSLAAGRSGEVTVALSAGSYTFPVNGANKSGTLRTDILHGATRSIDYQTGIGTTRDHSYTFLPQHPRISPQDPTSREAGEPVMRVIAAHEFLHALGLDAHDPSLNGLLAAQWIPNEGATAAQDTLSPFGSSVTLPPLILSGDTISRLKALWP